MLIKFIYVKYGDNMSVKEAVLGKEYTIRDVNTKDNELDLFLCSLGCCRGEKITVISRLKNSVIISLKDTRYSIDTSLAEKIAV